MSLQKHFFIFFFLNIISMVFSEWKQSSSLDCLFFPKLVNVYFFLIGDWCEIRLQQDLFLMEDGLFLCWWFWLLIIFMGNPGSTSTCVDKKSHLFNNHLLPLWFWWFVLQNTNPSPGWGSIHWFPFLSNSSKISCQFSYRRRQLKVLLFW